MVLPINGRSGASYRYENRLAMAYDLELAELLRRVIVHVPVNDSEMIVETKMFGGLCFTLNGKMLVGIDKSRLVIRISTDRYEQELLAGRIAPMDLTGRPLRNFAFLAKTSWDTDAELSAWIEHSAQYVRENMLGKPVPRPRRRV